MQTNFIYLSTHIHTRHICTRIDAHTCAWTEDPAHSSSHIHMAVQLAARNGHIIFHDGQVQGQGRAVAGDRAAVGVSLGAGGGGRSWSRPRRTHVQGRAAVGVSFSRRREVLLPTTERWDSADAGRDNRRGETNNGPGSFCGCIGGVIFTNFLEGGDAGF